MTKHPLWSGENPWLYGAAAVCAAFWLLAVGMGVKLTNIYEGRGPMGFRHAIAARVDHRIGQLAGVAFGGLREVNGGSLNG